MQLDSIRFKIVKTKRGKLDTPISVGIDKGPFDMKNNPQTNTDTVLVKIEGGTEKNIEVIPYYTLQDVQFSINISRTVTAKFGLNQVIKK